MTIVSDDKNLSSIEVVSKEDAHWLRYHNYASIVGRGEVVNDDGKVTEVTLVRAKEESTD